MKILFHFPRNKLTHTYDQYYPVWLHLYLNETDENGCIFYIYTHACIFSGCVRMADNYTKLTTRCMWPFLLNRDKVGKYQISGLLPPLPFKATFILKIPLLSMDLLHFYGFKKILGDLFQVLYTRTGHIYSFYLTGITAMNESLVVHFAVYWKKSWMNASYTH